jgi:Dolichyl-phosphate-mannose-protein mannosyltransferase
VILPSLSAGLGPRRKKVLVGAALALAIVLFLALSWSDDHFWDEFFYLYSVRFHSIPELIRFESVSRLFPTGFFSQKLGHLLLLSGLTQVFREGVWSVNVIEVVYAFLLLGSFAAGYGCLRELLGPRQARDGTLVLAFSPLALYLGYKMLSEVPSLLFITLGCWAFLRSFRSGLQNPIRWLVFATLALGVGTICRLTGIVSFGALGVALLLAGDERFERRRLLVRLVVVGLAAVVLQAGALVLVGGSDVRLGSNVYNVLSTHPLVQRLYAIALFVQTFALVLPFAWHRRDKGVVLGLIWLAVAVLPFLAGHEPRYYMPALLPFAIVAAAGFRAAGELLAGERQRWAAAVLLAGLVLFNRLVLLPLMPFEVQQRQLVQAFEQVSAPDPYGTYLVSWSSDYSLLRFVFPDAPIELSLSRTPESRYAVSDTIGPIDPADQWWAGRDHYVGSLGELRRRSAPWYYLGWTYNPAALRLEGLLAAVHLSRVASAGAQSLHSHLAGSWVWYDRALTLVPVPSRGQYRVYRVLPRPRHASVGGFPRFP